jgi:hypothetical protein
MCIATARFMSDPSSVYIGVLDTLAAANVPFLVGGSVAIVRYTGIERRTKDLDLFLRPSHYEDAAKALTAAGYEVERTHPHWLGKARADGHCVDLIFNSGNGLSPVDDAWFEHAGDGEVLGRSVRLMPAEELIWTKLFIMERERFDGADVAHLLRDMSDTLDWRRLSDRVGPNWRVLLSHLILFGFIYPAEQDKVPGWLLDELLQRLEAQRSDPSSRDAAATAESQRLCQGTLLSRQQYLHDVRAENYRDARATELSSMTPQDIAAWTAAIERDGKPSVTD